MHAISDCFDEYHKRWESIEALCGYSIVSHPTHSHPVPGYHRGPTRGDSSASLISISTIGSRPKGSPDLSRQRGGSISSTISSIDDSFDMMEPRVCLRSQSSGPSESGVDSMDTSPLNHSFSAPILKRPSHRDWVADNMAELNSDKLKSLEPIREEIKPTSTVKKRIPINRKYKSSEV